MLKPLSFRVQNRQWDNCADLVQAVSNSWRGVYLFLSSLNRPILRTFYVWVNLIPRIAKDRKTLWLFLEVKQHVDDLIYK